MDLRNVNAGLQATYGPNAWLIRNYQLEGEAKEMEAEVEQWREKVTEVNRSRRVFQEEKGRHLSALETRWQDLVTGTVQLELANVALQGEVEALARKAEALERELEERV
jgi:pre-mRNA-splicing factor SPF27